MNNTVTKKGSIMK